MIFKGDREIELFNTISHEAAQADESVSDYIKRLLIYAEQLRKKR